LIKYIKSVLWRVAKCLSYIEEARCLKVKKSAAAWLLCCMLQYVWAVLTTECLGGGRPDPLSATGTLSVWWHIEEEAAMDSLSSLFRFTHRCHDPELKGETTLINSYRNVTDNTGET